MVSGDEVGEAVKRVKPLCAKGFSKNRKTHGDSESNGEGVLRIGSSKVLGNKFIFYLTLVKVIGINMS